MNPEEMNLTYSAEGDSPVIEIGETSVASLRELVDAVPDLKAAEQLPWYCRALNHLEHGLDYRIILEPDAFRRRYEARYRAEDPDAPFQEGVIRLRDFGHCEMGEIQPPRLDGGSVVFYVEDDSLGIPYRVTGPAPGQQDGEVQYEPLPMEPDEA